MKNPHGWRVFGIDTSFDAPRSSEPRSGSTNEVRVALGDILPALQEALDSGRMWLADFHDDPITISRDLHEVLLACQELRRAA